MGRLADSLASSSPIPDRLQDISANCAAVVTCVGELQATTSRLMTEVKSLTVAVKANTAAIAVEERHRRCQHQQTTTRQLRMQAETNAVLTRIAVRWRAGSQNLPGVADLRRSLLLMPHPHLKLPPGK